jgi:hypothetical protein
MVEFVSVTESNSHRLCSEPVLYKFLSIFPLFADGRVILMPLDFILNDIHNLLIREVVEKITLFRNVKACQSVKPYSMFW